MPWIIKKIGDKYCVAKKSTGKCTGPKRYSSRKAATPYLRALYASEDNENLNEIRIVIPAGFKLQSSNEGFSIMKDNKELIGPLQSKGQTLRAFEKYLKAKGYKDWQVMKEDGFKANLHTAHGDNLNSPNHPYNDPEHPMYDQPEQCTICHGYKIEGEQGSMQTMDLDPGDPEVGPQPDIGDHWVCDKCTNFKNQHGRLPRTKYNKITGDVDVEGEEANMKNFTTVSESIIGSLNTYQEGYWYEILNPRYEYRANSKKQKIIALPPRFVTGSLLETKNDKFVRLENKINDDICANYGMRRVENSASGSNRG